MAMKIYGREVDQEALESRQIVTAEPSRWMMTDDENKATVRVIVR
jgi:hypothetical protein